VVVLVLVGVAVPAERYEIRYIVVSAVCVVDVKRRLAAALSTTSAAPTTAVAVATKDSLASFAPIVGIRWHRYLSTRVDTRCPGARSCGRGGVVAAF
jgi:hypothetical protein